MKLTTTTVVGSAVAAGAILALIMPLSASAHIGVDAASTAAGSSTVLTFALPHGCDGSATSAISIDIPQSIASVTPTVNANWIASEVEVDLAAPIDDGHGNAITTRTGAVVYTANTPMPDGLRDTFALSLQLPADAAGETLEFPVLQTCVEGETKWNESTVEGEAEPEHPAPAILVTAASADEHSHGDAATDVDTAVGAAADTATGTAPAATQGGDVLARVLGVGGLVVGAVGVVLAATSRRSQAK